MKNIEDEEIRKGVFLVLKIKQLELEKEEILKKIEAMSTELATIPEDKQLEINKEILRIAEERGTT